MAEYIDRNVVVNALIDVENRYNLDRDRTVIPAEMLYMDLCRTEISLGKLPAADVAPVVHGRWDSSGRYKFTDGSIAVRRTKCGCSLHEKEYMENVWNYCPVCGAKMELED